MKTARGAMRLLFATRRALATHQRSSRGGHGFRQLILAAIFTNRRMWCRTVLSSIRQAKTHRPLLPVVIVVVAVVNELSSASSMSRLERVVRANPCTEEITGNTNEDNG